MSGWSGPVRAAPKLRSGVPTGHIQGMCKDDLFSVLVAPGKQLVLQPHNLLICLVKLESEPAVLLASSTTSAWEASTRGSDSFFCRDELGSTTVTAVTLATPCGGLEFRDFRQAEHFLRSGDQCQPESFDLLRPFIHFVRIFHQFLCLVLKDVEAISFRRLRLSSCRRSIIDIGASLRGAALAASASASAW